jgi:subtilisin family serine protease
MIYFFCLYLFKNNTRGSIIYLTNQIYFMKKTNYLIWMMIMLFIASCTNNESIIENNDETFQEKLLSVQEIMDQINETIELEGSFDWTKADDQLLWSATVHGSNLLTVGYGDNNDGFRLSENNRAKQIKTTILNVIKSSEKTSKEDVLIYEDPLLNYIDVKVEGLNTIRELRKLNNIRYLEPDGVVLVSGQGAERSSLSSSGCGFDSDYISSSDYGTLSTGAKIPWNYYDHKINQAWSYSKGRGIGVGVIDTGLSPSQANLSYKFDDYYSGRYIQKYGTYIDSNWWWSNNLDGPNDRCGHGTSCVSAISAPNNNSGSFVGVAYECNMVSYRGTSDVVLNDYHEKKGVANALKALGNRNDIKIISMSVGYPWSIGRVKDAVRYAYYRGKLIFAAGGTSTSFTNWYGVIFPATMSETVAVTGVEEQASYNECDVCHKGSKIDFTFVMERGNNHHQPVLGFYNYTSNYFGGSSVATASTAGIAALVWARYPYWNRNHVLNRLKFAGDFYPNRNSNFGYGNINALKAVRGY